MARRINAWRLQGVLTVAWLVAIAVVFAPKVNADRAYTARVRGDMADAVLERSWQECAKRETGSTTPEPFKCGDTVQAKCQDAGPMYVEGCRHVEYQACKQSSVPACSYIYMDAQRDYIAQAMAQGRIGQWKTYAVDALEGGSLWIAIAIAAAGIVAIYGGPPALRRAREWLTTEE